MSINNPDTHQAPKQTFSDTLLSEEQIDLRGYVLVLVAWWREILLITIGVAVLAASGVLFLRLSSDPVYESSATIAIARTQNTISFDERFTTLSQDDQPAISSVGNMARRSALVGLVSNGAVAQAMIDQMGALLSEGERSPGFWLSGDRVNADLVSSSDGQGSSDLIRITVRAESPEKAAMIANAWAKNYVEQVNRIYGQIPQELVQAVAGELIKAQAEYESAQKELEAFVGHNDLERVSRLIQEKQDIISSLQAGKQTAITTIVDEELQARRQIIVAYIAAQASNRLLAFTKEQESKQAIISALIDADTNSRLGALQKDREIRMRIFSQYVDAEIANRLVALEQEQDSKRAIFSAYTSADVQSKLAVFNEQVQERIKLLASYYDSKAKLTRLVDSAKALREQTVQAGEASAATNSLAILLLKSQAYATSTGLPGSLQITLGSVDEINSGAEGQVEDLDALIQALANRITELELAISLQSQKLLDNEGLEFLTPDPAENDALWTAIQQKYLDLFQIDQLGTLADSVAENTALSSKIVDKYNELFGVSIVAQASTSISVTTPIFLEIQRQYPDLFAVDALAGLTDLVSTDNPLAMLGTERAKELLQLQGLEDLPSYTAAAEPLTQAIDRLESDIQTLQMRQEAETSRQQQLLQRRDLAWSTLTTLENKNTELSLSTVTVDSEVRLASPAVEPLFPTAGTGLLNTTMLAGIVGLMAAIFIVFFANFMGANPWLASRPR
ncbi:MAG: hypothetical protein WBO46_14440 [Caldilineaceae bacterium]